MLSIQNTILDFELGVNIKMQNEKKADQNLNLHFVLYFKFFILDF